MGNHGWYFSNQVLHNSFTMVADRGSKLVDATLRLLLGLIEESIEGSKWSRGVCCTSGNGAGCRIGEPESSQHLYLWLEQDTQTIVLVGF